MTTAPTTNQTLPPEDEDGERLGDWLSPWYLLDQVWKFLTSKVTGLVLILLMGLLSLAGTLLAQAPDGMRDDPQAYQSWLDSVRPRYAGLTDLLNAIGFFQIFSSIWFKGVSILLAVSILACSFNRAPMLWQRAMRPRTHVGDALFAHGALTASMSTPQTPEKARSGVESTLRKDKYRVLVEPSGQGFDIYADRFRFGPFGTVLAHVAFVIILLGVLISGSAGFKDNQFSVPIGSKVDVGHDTGLTVEGKAFSDDYYPDGSPRDYFSDLVLYKDGKKVKEATVRVNSPMNYDGVSFHQSSFGVAAVMSVKDAKGTSVYDNGVALVWSSNDGRHSVGQFVMPDQGLSVFVVGVASGETDPNIGAGQMQVEVYQNGAEQPIATEVLTQGKPLVISGLTYTFVRERQFTGLLVSQDPGAVWVWIGSSLMVLGLFMVFFFPHRRIWIQVRRNGDGSTIRLASPTRRDLTFESHFSALTTEVNAAVGARQAKVGQQ